MKKINFFLLLTGLSILSFSQGTRKFYMPGQLEKIEVDSLTKLIKENPKNAEAYAKRGDIIFRLYLDAPDQKYVTLTANNALIDINKAISLKPKEPSFYQILSDYYFFYKDNIDTAIIIMNNPIKLDSTNATWYNNRAFLKAKADKSDSACEDWLKGSTLQGKDAETCRNFYARRCKK